jgi:hypothetical protein
MCRKKSRQVAFEVALGSNDNVSIKHIIKLIYYAQIIVTSTYANIILYYAYRVIFDDGNFVATAIFVASAG